MFKKFLKGLIISAVMLLSVGAVNLVPTFSNSKENIKVEQTSADELSSLWTDSAHADAITTVTANSNGTLEQRLAANYTVKKISSRSDLIELSLAVKNGTSGENTTSTVYFLENDIDLSSGLWTPIGDSTHPFKAIFYGNGKTISGVVVNDSSVTEKGENKGAGLFGINDGVIANLNIGLGCYINVTGNETKKGNLVGINRGYVVECNSNQNIGQNSYANRVIDSVVSFNANGGCFYRANTKWYENDVLKTTSNSDLTAKFDYYQVTSNLTLRRNATATNIYPLKKGYKPTWNTSTGGNIAWTSSTEDVYFYYQYGTRNDNNAVSVSNNLALTVQFGYDQTFDDWFSDTANYHHIYKTRAGYTLDSITNAANGGGTAYNITGSDYQKAYPCYSGNTANSNVYLNWG